MDSNPLQLFAEHLMEFAMLLNLALDQVLLALLMDFNHLL